MLAKCECYEGREQNKKSRFLCIGSTHHILSISKLCQWKQHFPIMNVSAREREAPGVYQICLKENNQDSCSLVGHQLAAVVTAMPLNCSSQRQLLLPSLTGHLGCPASVWKHLSNPLPSPWHNQHRQSQVLEFSWLITLASSALEKSDLWLLLITHAHILYHHRQICSFISHCGTAPR